MSFLSSLVSCFFINYILWLIFRALNVKNARKVYIILISVIEGGTIIFNIYYLIRVLIYDFSHKVAFNDILLDTYYYGSYPLAIFCALIITLMLTLSGVRLIKSRRTRAFEREINGGKSISTTVFNIVLLSVGVILLGVAVAILILSNGVNVYFFTIGGFGLLFIILGIVLLINYSKGLSGKEKKVKGNNLFFVKTNGTYYTYYYEANKGQSLEESLGRIGSIYIPTDFGVLKTIDNKYNVYGITPSDIEMELVDSINLPKIDNDYSDAFNSMSKYKRVLVTLDENNNVSNVRDI